MLFFEMPRANSSPIFSRPFSSTVETPFKIPSIAATRACAGTHNIGVASAIKAAIGILPAAALTDGDFGVPEKLTCDGRCDGMTVG